MNFTKEYLKGAAAELKEMAEELNEMAKKGIDPKRLDEIARLQIRGTANILENMAYQAGKAVRS